MMGIGMKLKHQAQHELAGVVIGAVVSRKNRLNNRLEQAVPGVQC